MGHMLIILFPPLVGIPAEEKNGEIKNVQIPPRCPSHISKGDKKKKRRKASKKTPKPLKSGVTLINTKPHGTE